MWCTCTGSDRQAGFVCLSQEYPSEFFVHAPCLKPTKMVFERTVNMRVPHGAVSISKVHARQTGVNEVTFVLEDKRRVTCLYYHPYPKKDMMTEPRDLLLKWWQDLDTLIDQIRLSSFPDEAWKVRASSLAEILADVMVQFYPDSKAVLAESMARWKARQAGETRETPGLAESIWDNNTRWDGTSFSKENEAKARAGGKVTVAPKKTGNLIPDTGVETARSAVETGMFTVAQLATTYKMTDDEVKAQLGLA